MTGQVLSVSCAYSGRVAVAYRAGGVSSHSDDPRDQFKNIKVSIYECESTGTVYTRFTLLLSNLETSWFIQLINGLYNFQTYWFIKNLCAKRQE